MDEGIKKKDIVNFLRKFKVLLGSIKYYTKTYEKNLMEFTHIILGLGNNKRIEISIDSIMVKLQDEDILQQQLNHLITSINKTYSILEEIVKGEKVKDYFHILILVDYISKNNQLQIERINIRIEKMITIINCESFVIENILNLNQGTLSGYFTELQENHKEMISIMELNLNIMEMIEGVKKDTSAEFMLDSCKYKEVILNNMVYNLTVEEERETVSKIITDIPIEKSLCNGITLF